LADKIMPITLKPREKMMILSGENPILIQAAGDINLKNNSEIIQELKQGEVFGDLFQEGPTTNITEVEAINRAVIFKITLADFYFVMASHYDLAQGLIYNVTEKKKTENETVNQTV
jgi:ATP:ADP antiporter, AAA family